MDHCIVMCSERACSVSVTKLRNVCTRPLAGPKCRTVGPVHIILFVDDDVEILGVLGDALSSPSLRVLRFSSASQALQAVETQPFSALLADAVPGVEELLSSFKERNPYSPMIVLTGGLPASDEDRLRQKGADLVLFKPLGIAAIRENVDGLISAAAQRTSAVSVFDVDLQAVVETEQRLIEAMIKGDLAALNELLADGYTFVAGDIRETKAERMQSVRTGRLRFKEIEVIERSAKHYADVCVITSVLRVTGERGGRDISGDYNAVRIYSRKAGKWRAVGGQLTANGGRVKSA